MEAKMKKIWEAEAKITEFDHFCSVSKNKFLHEIAEYRENVTKLDAISKTENSNPVLYDTIWSCINSLDWLIEQIRDASEMRNICSFMREFYDTVEVLEKLLA